MSHRAARDAEADRGFTLVETIVVVALTGLVMAVLSAATVAVIRMTPAVGQHIDDARTVRGLSTWLSQDVMSTYAVDVTGTVTDPWSAPASAFGFDTHPGNPGRCDPVAGSTNLVQMAWRQSTAGSTIYVVNYRFDPSSGDASVIRLACSGSTLATLTTTSTVKLTEGLADTQAFPGVADYDESENELILELESESGAEILIEVASRNPGTP